MRERYADLPPAEWTLEEAVHHTGVVFDQAARAFPDLMEPYVVQLAESSSDGQREIMRRGLRETILKRYPQEVKP